MSARDGTRTTILRLTHIEKSFGGVRALVDVDFDLRPGEIHALVGENGAGKSTLIKIIAGAYAPEAGTIEIGGRRTVLASPLAAQRQGIAAIFQEPTLYLDLDVAENIYMGHHPRLRNAPWIRWRDMHSKAAELLRMLGAELDPRARARSLSIAQMQMVEMAKALSIEAKILIMDEPTSALTQHEVEELFRIVRRLKSEGVAVIFISHRIEEILQIADRVTVLRDGRQVGCLPIQGLSGSELIRLMVGRTLETLFPKREVLIAQEALRVEGLARGRLFRDISFSLRRGEILALAGLVGARRTEVAQTLFGIHLADAGSIWIDGDKKLIRSPIDALACGLAYVPEDRQMHGLIPGMTIKENVTLAVLERFAIAKLIHRRKEAEHAAAMAEQLQIKAAGLWQRTQELSGGNQQKTVLAKWLGTSPRILILDEPTRGIDVGTKAAVHKLMGELAGSGVAILMISSELPEVIGMSDRILVMCEGRLTGEFSRAEATQERIMQAATRRLADR